MEAKYPIKMKLKCALYTDDGGKTWFVGDVFYLVDSSPEVQHLEKDNFLDSSRFEGMSLAVVESG